MNAAICKVVATGLAMTIQDQGRPGWRRFGVPAGGAMDDHAALWANRLINNRPNAPLAEILGAGARLEFIRDTWIAVTGADCGSTVPRWRATRVHNGDELFFAELRAGMWSDVAVEGGFDTARWLGSASAYPRGGLGTILHREDVLYQIAHAELDIPAEVSSRLAPWTEQRNYAACPPLRLWPGPQWSDFPASARERLFAQEWTVSSQSDRMGYRLVGEKLEHQIGELISEPVLPGTIQVPENGQPIVTMRDGPTVGGYAKLAVLDAADISWFAQMQPGQRVRFVSHEV